MGEEKGAEPTDLQGIPQGIQEGIEGGNTPDERCSGGTLVLGAGR